MKSSIHCPCGKIFSVEIEEEIDLDASNDNLEKINNGTFMSFICPGCEKKHKPEYKIKILWNSRNLKFEILPEPDRNDFYLKKKVKTFAGNNQYETIIGYPEMADRISVINDNLEPVVIETLKYYLLVKADENYPDRDINAWYHGKGDEGIEFHLDGIRPDEVAVMKVPMNVYDKTCKDYRKHPKNGIYRSLRSRSYMSVQNLFRPEAIK
ncbi:MAG: CpXC domain-containing protein [Treponema sp.]|nr:CpXC domain-containing protein [Treponema sp.]